MSLSLSNRALIGLLGLFSKCLKLPSNPYFCYCAAAFQHVQLQLEHDDRSIHLRYKCNQIANHSTSARALPAAATTQEKATSYRGFGTLWDFLKAFLGAMEKLEGGRNVPIKLWRQSFTPGFIAIWSLETCGRSALFGRSEACTTSESQLCLEHT